MLYIAGLLRALKCPQKHATRLLRGYYDLQGKMYAVTIELVELLDEASMSLLWSYGGIGDDSMVRVRSLV